MHKQEHKVLKPVKTSKHIVLKDFTLDKLYKRSETIELADGKAKKELIKHKYIK